MKSRRFTCAYLVVSRMADETFRAKSLATSWAAADLSMMSARKKNRPSRN